ncbi:Uncharacterized iron-regulated protein [Candidatus Terasakiella magnetica]|nr:Uncharacterized iron-regulated protein [Candidatus Terasakiella magnetica]
MDRAEAPLFTTQPWRRIRVLTALFALVLAFPAAAAEAPPRPTLASSHSLAGRIWQPSTRTWLSPEDLMAEILAAGMVILGETHDNPDHHAVQAWVVRRLGAAGRRPLTAFEMMDTDEQGKIDATLAAHPGQADFLGEALEWNRRGWPDWPLYRPIVEATLAAKGEIKGANLPRDLTRQIARGGASADIEAQFGLDSPLRPTEAKAMEAEIRDGHCNMLPDSAIPGMVKVQRARDAAMAEVLAFQATRPEAGPAVLITGSGHARTDRGVPARTRHLLPGIPIVSLALVEAEDGETAPAAYARLFGAQTVPFDAIWFTAKAAREDQCAQLGKHLEKKKGKE